MNQKPDFIIIGAMKCATSTLHEQLALQSGIFMSELKEPNFFSNDEQYARGLDWYQAHFAAAQADELCGESSTHYTKLPTYPQTIERLQGYLPEVKLIYVMRHPIKRLVSQYVHEWSQRRISVEINQAVNSHPELIDYSRYTLQLEPYFKAFGPDRVLPVFFERLFHTPQIELERVCQFIGYSSQPTWQTNLEAQNVSNERMQSSGWRDFLVEAPGLKQIRQTLVPKSFRIWLRGLWTMKERPELSAEQTERLQDIFDQDLAVLGRWLGMPLNCAQFELNVLEAPEIRWSQVQSMPVPHP
ncbi:MAG: sulfotransferase domain-containing protein [Oscillatoriales cyanobacterium RM2_1_1]|nr:sulfotransferase domain-containing protein [Oscillatoriales cyanobacterium SM2_3_0]NJO46418.1 sulfotransferase domain-containing protein [Oscillatoriales cyanobacterium RM2_1_1]